MSGKRRRMETVGVRLPVEIIEVIDRRVKRWNQEHLFMDRSDYLRKLIVPEMLRSHHRRKSGKKVKR